MTYECSCGEVFDEMEQTRSEYRDGKCPRCGSDDIKEKEDNDE